MSETQLGERGNILIVLPSRLDIISWSLQVNPCLFYN